MQYDFAEQVPYKKEGFIRKTNTYNFENLKKPFEKEAMNSEVLGIQDKILLGRLINERAFEVNMPREVPNLCITISLV